MTHTARRRFAGAVSAVAASLAGLAGAPVAAQAQGLFTQPKYAAIVEDANTGEVLYAMRADALRYPASITKVMTLYLTFEALATGRLTLHDQIVISPHAYSMAPSKVSTHPGEVLSVAQAIPTVTVHSANDVAVALAEKIGGSEARFAQLMTLRAHELGMTSSTFVNASGLPDTRQIVTARDIATLSRAIMRDYPQYYAYFGLKSTEYNGKLLLNHNHLVARMPGVDGLKTGFTNAAGFNLAASGVRDGHRLITVVLGGPSTAARDENVEELLDAGFTVLKGRATGQRMRLASLIASPDDMSGPVIRPPVEEGSADQPNLQVEVQPQLRTLPTLAAARALSEAPPRPAVAEAEPAAPDCASGRGARHPRHVRRHEAQACVGAARTPAMAAASSSSEENAAARPCTAHRRRHHAAACDADAALAAAPASRSRKAEGAHAEPAHADRAERAHAEPAHADRAEGARAEPAHADRADMAADTGKGGYMIQVGAYRTHTLAQGQIEKVSPLVAGAGKVEQAGGNYRARFRGLSEKQARTACKTLSAKGQACMVMASS